MRLFPDRPKSNLHFANDVRCDAQYPSFVRLEVAMFGSILVIRYAARFSFSPTPDVVATLLDPFGVGAPAESSSTAESSIPAIYRTRMLSFYGRSAASFKQIST